MKKIDVCLSPDLIHLYDLSSVAVVVVDIFRATSCMVTAFASGAAEIVPVEEVELCQQYGAKGYLTAAERNGITPAGFDFDNSPFSYQVEKVKGAKFASPPRTAPSLYVGRAAHLRSMWEHS